MIFNTFDKVLNFVKGSNKSQTFTLENDLVQIRKVLDLEKIIQQGLSQTTVNQYYKFTNYFYRKFHSREGAMHFPLYLPNRAKNHFEGLYEQANLVQDQININQAQKVLEIGCGQGFNSIFLASQNLAIQFTGLDLTPLHIQQAQEKTQDLKNIQFQIGDFQHLDLPENQYDIIFAVESFCYTQDLRSVLQQLHKILKPKGRIVIFDVFLQPDFQQVEKDLQLSSQLTAIGFAVKDWWNIEALKENAQAIDFQIISLENFAQAILPNLRSFQRGSRKMFRYPQLIKTLLKLKIIPSSLVKHAMTGVLAPYTIGDTVQGYFQVVLEKS